MQFKIKKIGHRMGIVLPAHIIKRFNLKVSSQIEINIVDKKISFVSTKDKEVDSLRLLFKGYKGTYHPTLELDYQSKGNEVW